MRGTARRGGPRSGEQQKEQERMGEDKKDTWRARCTVVHDGAPAARFGQTHAIERRFAQKRNMHTHNLPRVTNHECHRREEQRGRVETTQREDEYDMEQKHSEVKEQEEDAEEQAEGKKEEEDGEEEDGEDEPARASW